MVSEEKGRRPKRALCAHADRCARPLEHPPNPRRNSPLRLGWVMAPAHLVTPARDVGPSCQHLSLPPSHLTFAAAILQ